MKQYINLHDFEADASNIYITNKPLPHVSNGSDEMYAAEGWYVLKSPVYDNNLYVLGEIYFDYADLYFTYELAPADPIVLDIVLVEELIMTSARDYRDNQIYAEGLILVDRILRNDPSNEKALKVETWLDDLWLDAYTRVAYVMNGDTDYSTDFSNNGNKPHTIAELQQELL